MYEFHEYEDGQTAMMHTTAKGFGLKVAEKKITSVHTLDISESEFRQLQAKAVTHHLKYDHSLKQITTTPK